MEKTLLLILSLFAVFTLPATAQNPGSSMLDSNYIDAILLQADTLTTPSTRRIELQKALAFSRELPYPEGVWRSLIGLFRLEKPNPELTEALRYALESESLLQKVGEWPVLFILYGELGELLMEEGFYSEALTNFRRAEALAGEYPGVDVRGATLEKQIGSCYLALNHPDSARIYFRELLEHYRNESDGPGQIYVYRQLVQAAMMAQDYRGALEHNLAIEALIQGGERPDLVPVITNNIGYNYFYLGNNDQAIAYFERTLKLIPEGDAQLGTLYNNLGVAYHNTGNHQEAINNLTKAHTFYANLGDSEQAARISNVIATIFLKNRDLYNALEFNETAIAEGRLPYRPAVLVEAYATAGEIHEKLFNYETALDYLQKHLTLRDSLLLEERLRERRFEQQRTELERSQKDTRLYLVKEEVQNLMIDQLKKDQELKDTELERSQLEYVRARQEILAQERNQEILQLERDRAAQDLRIAQQELVNRLRDQEIARLERDSAEKAFSLARQKLEAEAKDQQIQNLEREQQIQDLKLQNQDLELARQARNRQYAGVIFGGLFIILALILRGLIFSRRTNRQLAGKNAEIEAQKQEIERGRDETEALLLNILPRDTANELRANGAATPRNYELVTVLFTDFSGFTRITEKMSPQELVDELNICFRAFDEIVEEHGLEKIKTIGDGYMCAGGIPQPNQTNPLDTVRAGRAMMSFLEMRRRTVTGQGLPYWEMRIGVHTGPVIAGVVGRNKFAYDIWGDTVNTASRMESYGEAGKINVSEATYQYIKPYCTCTYRGAIDVKNKGKINMYFVE